MGVPDYIGFTRCLAHLSAAGSVVDIFNRPLGGTRNDLLMAFQTAFDLVENATQHFVASVLTLLAPKPPPASAPPPAVEGGEAAPQPRVWPPPWRWWRRRRS